MKISRKRILFLIDFFSSYQKEEVHSICTCLTRYMDKTKITTGKIRLIR